MGKHYSAFISEYRRNFRQFYRGYTWVLLILIVIAFSIFFTQPSYNLMFAGINSPIPLSYFYLNFYANVSSGGIIFIWFIVSSLVVSEDSELGRLEMLRVNKIPVNTVLISKIAWLITFSFFVIIVLDIIFSLFLFTKYTTFRFRYLGPMFSVMALYLLVFILSSLEGVFISSIFSKRYYSIFAAILMYLSLGFVSDYLHSLYLNISSLNPKNEMTTNINGFLIVSKNFSFFDKFVFLFYPENSYYYISKVLNVFSINVATDNSIANGKYASINIPLLFYGQEYYFIVILSLIILILLSLIFLINWIKPRLK